MIRHVVLFKFRGGVKVEDKDLIFNKLNEVSYKLDFIKSWSVGKQIREFNPSNRDYYDLIEIADFDSVEGLNKFRSHSLHKEIRQLMMKIADWTVFDYQL